MAKQGTKSKKNSRTYNDAVAHIYATFNNTIINITDKQGNTLTWASAGGSGFKGSRKSTPFAAQVAASKAGDAAKNFGISNLEIEVSGPGAGREGDQRSKGRADRRRRGEEQPGSGPEPLLGGPPVRGGSEAGVGGGRSHGEE